MTLSLNFPGTAQPIRYPGANDFENEPHWITIPSGYSLADARIWAPSGIVVNTLLLGAASASASTLLALAFALVTAALAK